MSKMIKLPLAEAKQMKGKMGREPIFLTEYIGYLKDLGKDEAGQIKISSDKEGFAVRRRIERATKQLGWDVEIKKVGNDILFWKNSAKMETANSIKVELG